METLQIEKSKALKAYNEIDAAGKILMHALFGQDAFTQKITDRVKTFKDACEVLGIVEPTHAIPGVVQKTLKRDSESIIAYTKLIFIARALNEGWEPEWTDSNQAKYFPWFEWKKKTSGFGFSGTSYDGWAANATVGSRLCFKTKELAEYAGKQFEEIYNEFLTL